MKVNESKIGKIRILAHQLAGRKLAEILAKLDNAE
jgi:hypothetical protein